MRTYLLRGGAVSSVRACGLLGSSSELSPPGSRVGRNLRYLAAYLLAFFLGAGLAGGFVSRPFVLMSAKESFALNGY